MHHLLRVLSYIRPYRHLTVITLFFAVFTVAMDLTPPWLIKKIIDGTVAEMPYKALAPFFVFVVLAYAGRNVSNSLRIRFNNTLEQKVIYDMRQELYGKLQNLPVRYFDDRSTGELLSRVNDDVNSVERVFIDGVEQFTVASLTLVGVTACLMFLNWKLALLAMVPIPVLIVGAFVYTNMVHKHYRAIRQKLAMMNAFLQDRISGVRVLKIFNRHRTEKAAFEQKNAEYCRANLKVARLWSLFTPGMMFVGSMGTVLILIFGSQQVLAKQLSVGEWVAFVSYLALFYEPINRIHALNHMVQHAVAAGRRIFEILDATEEGAATRLYGHAPEPSKTAIRWDGVSFAYKDGVQVLCDVTFDVGDKETVALVGLTGAGKSTLFGLMLRFYEGWRGRILYRGRDIMQMSLEELRNQFGMVFQEPFLFNGTVRENILYSAPEATEAAMIEASRHARAHDFIAKLTKGYDTLVGERGVRLSVGEKQRVTIARALLRDAPVILMDEATAHLDSQTETLIQEALEELTRGKTVMIIAHRLATVMRADRIVVLHEGRVRAQGPHQKLYDTDELYRNLIENHFRRPTAKFPARPTA